MDLNNEYLNLHLRTVFKEEKFITFDNCKEIGNALVIAPHPDDESLGCGGTIALLRRNGFSVQVVFITDGTMSHPNSKTYPSEELRKLREREGIEALSILGVSEDNVYFLRLPDSRLNELTHSSMLKNSRILQGIIENLRPNTIFLPWRKDPHSDHIATWYLCRDAIQKLSEKVKFGITILEYLVWFWERTTPNELNKELSIKIWRVGIEKELKQKEKAIDAHASQLGKIINDVPDGFSLSPQMLKKFYKPEEFFLEYHDF